MGFNPYRKFRVRRADYLFVVAAVAVAVALVAWGFLG
jgi:energy-coupling factor transporter transmembrane protein EcfT